MPNTIQPSAVAQVAARRRRAAPRRTVDVGDVGAARHAGSLAPLRASGCRPCRARPWPCRRRRAARRWPARPGTPPSARPRRTSGANSAPRLVAYFFIASLLVMFSAQIFSTRLDDVVGHALRDEDAEVVGRRGEAGQRLRQRRDRAVAFELERLVAHRRRAGAGACRGSCRPARRRAASSPRLRRRRWRRPRGCRRRR